MAIINTSKPTTTFTNTARASFAELWSTIATTWASETRTWAAVISTYTNTSKPRTLGSYTFDEIGSDLISAHGGAMNDSTQMINTAKP